jgi:hypothetical protein
MLYEVHDPTAYVTPDVVADFSGVRLTQVGEDQVTVTGVRGRARPDQLKVSVGYLDSWIGTGEISYAGPGALARGRLALDIVRERVQLTGLPVTEARYELIGVDAVHRGAGRVAATDPSEVRVRVAARMPDERSARAVGHEVTSLWLNGPAGGGGATRTVVEDVAVASVLLPRTAVRTETIVVES